MFNSETLEVGIGIVFIFLVASLAASIIREIIEGVLKARAVQLERGIRLLMNDPHGDQITKKLFDHPLLDSLFDGNYYPELHHRELRLSGFKKWMGMPQPYCKKRLIYCSKLPSYIPSRNFALAVMDLIGKSSDTTGPLNLQSIIAGATALPDSHVKHAVLVALGEAKGDLDRARASLEAWYDGTMDRVSGWYKRETQVVLFLSGLVIAALFNINSVTIVRELASNNHVRTQMISQLEDSYRSLAAASPEQKDKIAKIFNDNLINADEGLSTLIGWPMLQADFNQEIEINSTRTERFRTWVLYIVTTMLGWLITAGAVSLGAPFWFDVLNKLMVVRSTVKPYEKSPAEGSEDRKGGVPSAQQLVPSSTADPVVPSEGNPSSTAEAGAGGMISTSVTHIRLVIDVDEIDLTSAKLIVDGTPMSIPDDGFVELPLAVDVPHSLSVDGERDGAPVRWQTDLILTLNDEAIPLVATPQPSVAAAM